MIKSRVPIVNEQTNANSIILICAWWWVPGLSPYSIYSKVIKTMTGSPLSLRTPYRYIPCWHCVKCDLNCLHLHNCTQTWKRFSPPLLCSISCPKGPICPLRYCLGTGFNHNKINALILSSQLNFRRNVLNKNGDGLHFTSVQVCSLAGKVSILIFHYAPIMRFILSISFMHMTEMFLSKKLTSFYANR